MIEFDKYLDVPFPEYLADVDHVSNSMLKKLGRSPAHLMAYLNDEEARKPSDALITGRAAHAMVLETDSFDRYYYAIPDDLKSLTKPQQASIDKGKPTDLALKLSEQWAELRERAHGRELIRESAIEDVEAMRSVLMGIPKIKSLLSIGQAEQTRYFVDEPTGVKCKMRADFVHGSQQSVIVDYKTCEDAREPAFARSMVNYGYDLQLAHYKQGGKAEYCFVIAQEKTPPFAAALYSITTDWLQRGETLRRQHLNKYAECKALNEWPSYSTEIETLEIPRWAQLGE